MPYGLGSSSPHLELVLEEIRRGWYRGSPADGAGKEAEATMYKYLLCWRYLKTRYIALASIVSVMLGVATMIVVNSVMAGFAEKMRDRLHGVLSDVVVEGNSFDGFANAPEVMALVNEVGGDRVLAQAPTIETPGILSYQFRGQRFTKLVQIIGVRPEERAKVGDFEDFIIDDQGRKIPPKLRLSEEQRWKASDAGKIFDDLEADSRADEGQYRALAKAERPLEGAILGYATATYHPPGATSDVFLAPMGSVVILTFPGLGGDKRQAVVDSMSVTGYFQSGMSEYDATFVYVDLENLQRVGGMFDAAGSPKVNAVQVKTVPGTDLDVLAADIAGALHDKWPFQFTVETWEHKQGALLAAVSVEQSILNILLFFIIAVAGFGILAIFSMIVVEKTRDIGILKALGASTAGVRGIFLGYGLALGAVGSGVGMLGGLLFVAYINQIEAGLSHLLGRKVFDDTIYYFSAIPTKVDPWTVAWIVGGALVIAVAASVWPAQRAARLHPVRALRFE